MDNETIGYKEAVAYWKELNIGSSITLDSVLDSFKILFAYHSGKIENDKIEYRDTYEIFKNGIVTGYTGDTRTLFEQQNQKLCYELLLPQIEAKTPISIELVKETHKVLTSGTYDERRYIINNERPGEYKKHDYVVGINEVGYPPSDVPKAIADLLGEVSTATLSHENVLITAAYFHAVFENIHPFADGNGRTGRVLMNYYLLIHDFPPVVIREENRKEYYAALTEFDVNEDIVPLTNFLKSELVATWSGRIARTK